MQIKTEKLGELLAKMEAYQESIEWNFDLSVRVSHRRDPAYFNPNRKPVPWDDYNFDALGFSRIVFGLPKEKVLKNWNDVSLHYYGIPAGTRTFLYLWGSRWLMTKENYPRPDQLKDQMERIKDVLCLAVHSSEKVEEFCKSQLTEKLGL